MKRKSIRQLVKAQEAIKRIKAVCEEIEHKEQKHELTSFCEYETEEDAVEIFHKYGFHCFFNKTNQDTNWEAHDYKSRPDTVTLLFETPVIGTRMADRCAADSEWDPVEPGSIDVKKQKLLRVTYDNKDLQLTLGLKKDVNDFVENLMVDEMGDEDKPTPFRSFLADILSDTEVDPKNIDWGDWDDYARAKVKTRFYLFIKISVASKFTKHEQILDIQNQLYDLIQ